MRIFWAAFMPVVLALCVPIGAQAQEANAHTAPQPVANDAPEVSVTSVSDPAPELSRKAIDPGNNPPLPEPDTALWRLGDEDTTIYLLGTVHAFPEGTRWQNDAIREAIEQADELIVEANTDFGVFKMLGALAVRAFDASQPPLLERIPLEHRPQVASKVDALTDELGIARSFFDKLDTWAVAFLLDDSLDGAEVEEFAITYSGAEDELEEEFALLDKPIGNLESWQSQLDIFDHLSAEAQTDWLIATITTDEGGFDSLDDVIASWTSGDVDSIDMSEEVNGSQSAEILEALLFRRNRNWVDWIVERLDTPGTVLVAVGAGHLVGTNSVQDYLDRRGYTVERIR